MSEWVGGRVNVSLTGEHSEPLHPLCLLHAHAHIHYGLKNARASTNTNESHISINPQIQQMLISMLTLSTGLQQTGLSDKHN